MRVALFSRNARPADAIGRQVVAKQNAFRRLGAEVRVYVSEGEPRAAELGDVVALPAREVWRVPGHRDYLRSCDLIIAEFGAAYDLMELLPAFVGRGPKVVVDYHGVTPAELADPALVGELEAAGRQRGLLWCADVVLAHSRFAAEELRASTGLPAERIQVIPCRVAVDTEPGDADATRLRQRHGLADATVLLFVGRLARNKRPELLVQALEHLAPSVHAVFVGPQGDVYAARKAACVEEARRLGVAGRVHFVGVTDEQTLAAWYRAADVVVMPSAHECFGMPVIEALARGTPVLGADAAALPETLGHAGLAFRGDSAEDLARQVGRYLTPAAVPRTKRIAFVAHRFGTHFAGGAEASLRRMAGALRDAGYAVEVFTTCNDHESRWANTLPAGTRTKDGLTVHRFPVDPYDADALGRAYQTILQNDGNVDPDTQRRFLDNALGSEALLAALDERRAEFAAILTGPYLFKLVWDVARHFGEQVLLVPCFHDEPLARLSLFRETYRGVGGLLFHSAGESLLTAGRLAVNHSRHEVVGTLLPEKAFGGDAARGRKRCGDNYLVYCGRYCPEKGLDRLLRFMEQYAASRGAGVKLVCLGQGPMKLPRRPWLLDLGFVNEDTKRDVLAGALALVNLSPNESLSIVALEAWALGVPVIVSQSCAVLVEQVRRAEGGACVGDEEEFGTVLDTWLRESAQVHAMGESGRRFVRREYASPEAYAQKLVRAVDALRRPLRDVARERGLERARLFTDAAWQQRFAEIVERVRTTRSPRRRARVALSPVQKGLSAGMGQTSVSLTLRITNQRDVVVVDRGPARARLVAQVIRGGMRPTSTPLASPLLPGQEQLCVVHVSVPQRTGSYRLQIALVRGKRRLATRVLPLIVTRGMEGPLSAAQQPLAPLVQTARQALAEAGRLQDLPDDYVDVTEGKLAGLKRQMKRKLLNNFRRAYVDVAFRQQSALNRKLIAVMSLLLDTAAVPAAGEAALRRRVERLERQLRRERRLRRRLEERLERVAKEAVLSEGDSR